MAKRNKRNETEAVEAEVVEAGGSPLRGGVNEAALAGALTAKYRRAEDARGGFMRAAVAFGVELIEAERYLVAAATKYKTCKNVSKSRENIKKGRWGEGRQNSGLEAWLAERCPEIVYSTAKGYKMYATRVIAMMGGETCEVLAALAAPTELKISYEPSGAETDAESDVETVGDEIIRAREAIFTEATSRRKLEQMWLRFCTAEDDEAPRGDDGGDGVPVRKLSRAEEAKFVWNRFLQEAAKRSVKDAVPLLGEAETRVAYDTLGDVRALLKRHLDEFAGGAR